MKKLYLYITIINIFGAQVFGMEQSNSSERVKSLNLSIQKYQEKFELFLENNQDLPINLKKEKSKIKELFQECKVLSRFLKKIIDNPEIFRKSRMFLESNLSVYEYVQSEIEEYSKEIEEVKLKVDAFCKV